MEPKHIAYAVVGGIALIVILAWMVEHNLAKQIEQTSSPWDG